MNAGIKSKHLVVIAYPLLAAAFFYRLLASPLLVFGHDIQSQQYPWKVFAYGAIKRGELPLWNPHVMLGAPFIEGMQSGALYPPQLLFLFMPVARGMSVLLWAHVALAGAGMYALVYFAGRNRAGAFIAGVSYMLSGFVTARIVAGHFALIEQIALFPWIFLCAHLCVDSKRIIWACAAGVLWGAALLAGHPQFLYYEAIFIAAYFIFFSIKRTGNHPLDLWTGLLRTGAFAAAGAAVAMPQLLPSLVFHGLAARSKAGYIFATSGSLSAPAWLGLIAPTLFGDESRMAKWGYWSYWETCAYVGLAPLYLAASSLLARRKSRLEIFLLVSIVSSFLLAIGRYLFFYKFLYQTVPLLDDFRVPARTLIIFYFSVCVSCGLWFSREERRGAREGFDRSGPLLIACVCGALLLAILAVTAAGGDGAWNIIQDRFVSDYMRERIGPFESPGGALAGMPGNPARLNAAIAAATALAFNFAFMLIYIVYSADRSGARRRLFHVAIALLVAADLWTLGFRYAVTYPSRDKYEFSRDTVEILTRGADENPSRIITTSPYGRFANTGMMYGVDGFGGYDTTITRWYNKYYNYVQGRPLDWINCGNLAIENQLPPGFGWLNIGYVLDSPTVRRQRRGMKLVRSSKQVRIYKTGPASPRLAVVHKARYIADDKEMFKLLAAKGYDPRKEIYFSGGLDAGAMAEQIQEALSERGSEPRPAADSARFIRRGINEVEIEATARTTGFLFLADAYYPNWKAYIDGVETEVLRANYICRAVFLTTGSHRVKFVYTEPRLTIGLFAGIAALALMIPATLIYTAGGRGSGWGRGRGNT